MAANATTNETKPTSWMETPPRFPALRRASTELVAQMPWLDNVSASVQNWVGKYFGQPGEPKYKIKDFLAGVWFGHPVHPALVTLPIGAWSSSLVLDLSWLSSEDESVARSSDLLLWLGIASALASAATGISNWVDTDGMEKRTGAFHALLNGGVTVLNLSSGLLRLTGQRRPAITLSSLAFATTLVSAYVGGDLSYSMGIGMNWAIEEAGPDDYVAVMDEQDLKPGKLTRVEVEGTPVVLVKDGEKISAILAKCSHLGGPLDEGTYSDGVVHCPWHNSGFRMSDGCVVNSPAVYAQPTFAVRVRDGKIELRRLEHA